ncbi:PASTA domain-containing protein [Clostridium sp.]|uniref:PASTA domain-containing protein n=1 Tax=Clostridium sp. TaxID=1506 RepID=UPI0039F6290E
MKISWKDILEIVSVVLLVLIISLLIFGKKNSKKITDSSVIYQEDFIVVPEIIGQTPQEAKSILNKRGLNIQIVGEEYSEVIPKGKIVTQSPSVNDTAIEGTTIKIKISKGKKVEKDKN